MNINHISASRKQLFDECPLKYKYKYHLKLVSDEPEPVYFAYGKIIHKIADEYVKKKGKRLISEVANDILSGKIELERGRKAPPLLAEYKRKLPKHLKALQKLTDKVGYTGEREYKFEYDLDPPNKRYVTGFIDRLVKKGNQYWIIDYKTTKKSPWRKTGRDLIYDLQLRMYSRVVQKEFKAKAENIKAALYYLEGEELVGVSFSEESLDNVEKELLATYMNIKSMKPDDAFGKVGFYCKSCEYNKICPCYKP